MIEESRDFKASTGHFWEVEESWQARLANFITEIHAYADKLLAEEEWLKITKAKRNKTRNKRTTFKEDLSPQYTL